MVFVRSVVARMRIKTHKLINIIYTCVPCAAARAVRNDLSGEGWGVSRAWHVNMQNMNLNFKQIFVLTPKAEKIAKNKVDYIFLLLFCSV